VYVFIFYVLSLPNNPVAHYQIYFEICQPVVAFVIKSSV